MAPKGDCEPCWAMYEAKNKVVAVREKPLQSIATAKIVAKAKDQQKKAVLSACRVCCHKKVKQAVHELMAAMASGELIAYSFPNMRELLMEEYPDFDVSKDGLRRHAKHHEAELWRQIETVR